MKLCRGTDCRMTKKKKKRSTIRKFSTVASSPAGAWLLADLHLCPQVQCVPATAQTWSHQAGCHQALPQMGLKAEIQRLAHPAAIVTMSSWVESEPAGEVRDGVIAAEHPGTGTGGGDSCLAPVMPGVLSGSQHGFCCRKDAKKTVTRIQSSPGSVRQIDDPWAPAVTISRKCRKSNLLLLKKVASATGMFPYYRPSAAKYCLLRACWCSWMEPNWTYFSNWNAGLSPLWLNGFPVAGVPGKFNWISSTLALC